MKQEHIRTVRVSPYCLIQGDVRVDWNNGEFWMGLGNGVEPVVGTLVPSYRRDEQPKLKEV